MALTKYYTNLKLFTQPTANEDVINKKYFDDNKSKITSVDVVLIDADTSVEQESINVIKSTNTGIQEQLMADKIDGTSVTTGSIVLAINSTSAATFKTSIIKLTTKGTTGYGYEVVKTLESLTYDSFVNVTKGTTYGETLWAVIQEQDTKVIKQATQSKYNFDPTEINNQMSQINNKIITLQASLEGKLKDAVVAVIDENLDLSATYTDEQQIVLQGEVQIKAKEGARLLLIKQTNASENGIYEVKTSDGKLKLVRSADADANEDFKSGFILSVQTGKYADSLWTFTNDDAVELGTTELNFIQISEKTDFESINNSIDQVKQSVTDLTTRVDALSKKEVKTFATNGNDKSFTVDHTFNSTDISVSITDESGNDCIFNVTKSKTNVTISSDIIIDAGETFTVTIKPL